MIKRLSVFILLLSFVACKDLSIEGKPVEEVQNLNNLEWILGTWKREDSEAKETWTKINENLFEGKGVDVNDQGIEVVKELISLEKRADGIYYGAQVSDQNENRKIEFKMSNLNLEGPRFSNEKHDFPKHITYFKIGEDRIKVEISGTEDDVITFYFTREK